jgi:hypothetical protein
MIMLAWKELRENFKWALLAMSVLGMAEVHGLYVSQYGGMVDNYNDGVTLCKTAFLTVTTFGCAAVGFLIGLIQILPELKRDRWASLLHRPVPRGVILRGKVLGGLVLYAVATVPPFLFAVWLAATPGHFSAPFVPEMVTPGTADICGGAMWYFAALAVALQRGGWLILRVFPILAAVHGSLYILNNKFFHVAVEAAVLMALALFAAAWGEIQSPELLRLRPWLARFAFLAVVFYGACGMGELLRSFFGVVGTSAHSRNVQYELSEKGAPLRLTYVDNTVVKVEDLDGHPVTDPDYRPDRVRNHLRYLNTFSNYIGNSHGWRESVNRESYRQSRGYLWTSGAYSYPRLEQWFYVFHEKYLIGFQPALKLPFAILDRNGFEPATVRPLGFPSDMQVSSSGLVYSLWSAGGASLAFLPEREILPLPLPEPAPIFGLGNAFATKGNSSINVLGLALSHGLAVYDTKGKFITEVPYDRDMDRWGNLTFGISPELDRFYLWYHPSAWIDGRTKDKMPSYVEEINLQGQVLHASTVWPIHNPPNPRSWDTYLSQRLQSPAFYFGEMLYKKIGAELGSKRLRDSLAWYHGPGRRETREIRPVIIGLSVALSLVTLLWARRVYFSWPRAWAWAAFVLAFNLAGLITFRLAADWPRFVPCPSCGKRRAIEAKTCPHCGSGWPAPAASGIEIMDRPRAEAMAPASV